MNYEMEDLKARYMGARTQDNELLDSQRSMLAAQEKDDETIAQQVADNAAKTAEPSQDSTSIDVAKGNEALDQPLTDEQKGKVNGDTPKLQPDMGFEIPTPEMKFTGDREGEVITPEETMLQTVGRVTTDIVTNAPKNVSLGIVTGAKNAVDAVAPGFLQAADDELETMFPGYVEETNKFFNETLAGASTTDKVVQEMGGFMFHFGTYMKMLGATTKMGTISKGFAADALTSFYNVDPHLERLSSVAVEMGIENELVAYMADQTGTETENRFRNVLENQAIGGAFVSAAQALKGVWWAGKSMKAHHDKVGTEEFLLGPVAQRERGSVSMKPELPMDEASRMARAKEQGFDVDKPIFHGSADNIQEFDTRYSGATTGNNPNEVLYFTEDEGVARDYSKEAFNRRYKDNPEGLIDDGIVEKLPDFSGYDEQYAFVEDLALEQIKTHPSFIKAKKPLVVDWEGEGLDHDRAEAIVRFAKQGYDDSDGLIDDVIDSLDARYDAEDIANYKDEINERAMENFDLDSVDEVEDYMFSQSTDEIMSEAYIEPERFDSVIFNNIVDDIGEGSAHPQNTLMIFEPGDIRSTKAAFDPAKRGSAMVSAGLAGVFAAASTVAPEEAEAGLLDTIRARNAALNEAAGIDDVAGQDEMPTDPRTENQIIEELPDDIYLEWNQTTPIKEWLWITHPELLQGNGEA